MPQNNNKCVQAFIDGFKDAGCQFSTNYPGSSSQDIFFGLGGLTIASNEKSAFEQAYGASLAGSKTVVSLKSVGLNACADQFLHSVISGVNGGLVVVVIDDTQVIASQERQDSRHFIDFFGGLWLEPSSIQMAYDMAYESFELSEKLDIPVVIRVTSQLLQATGHFIQKSPKTIAANEIERNPEKYISYPVYWRRQWDNLIQKQKNIQQYVDSLYHKKTPTQSERSTLVFGACDTEVTADAHQQLSLLPINHYPLPKDYILKIAETAKTISIYEQGDNYAYKQVQNIIAKPMLDASGPSLHSDTGKCPDLPHQWVTWSHLENLFVGLKDVEPTYVVGDVGQFTVESEHVIDACLCLGSSIGVTIGVALAGVDYPFCITGDGSYLHGGALLVGEASSLGAAFGIVILDNKGSGATGGQPLAQSINLYGKAHKFLTIDYDKTNSEQFKKIFNEMKESKKLSILHINIKPGGAS